MAQTEHAPFGPLVDTTMSVATWNLWWRFGDHEARFDAIVDTLLRLDPDVIGLQEVWDDGNRNLAAELADAMGGRHWVYAAHLDMDDVRFGNAVLSRWPIVGSEERPLPCPADLDEHRVLLRADVDGPRGPLQLFTTHLNWRFDQSAIRTDQVTALSEFVRDSSPRTYPPIVTGDFNADPDSDEMRALTGAAPPPVPKLVFHDAWRAAGGHNDQSSMTWSNANPYAARDLEPDRRLDYVLTGWPKQGGRGHVVACDVFGRDAVDGVHPSDHYGVVATLRY